MNFMQDENHVPEDFKVTLNFLLSLEIEDLDEMVTDISYSNVNNELNATACLDCQELILSRAESVSCEVNNLGREAQIKYLFESGFRTQLQISQF
ncbi:hypothetical protein GCM10011607_12210 [Shewanella inventionis]|uniref:Uncharacterized protein n=1 Tax=Shewanella inventionis TaxID=1738770 RepID=A0ABQ1IV38_9GAMM|nr:hypothetical protein [Shewanella inventionis]GGB53240.1 hypothetical protein GCM10011607_12210 [Shewanella inventionis]